MPRYEVVEGVTVFDEYREAGTVLEIDEASALPLVESGNLRALDTQAPAPDPIPDQPAGEGMPPHVDPAPEAQLGASHEPTPDTVPPALETPPAPPAPEEAPTPTPAPAPAEAKGWVGNHVV